LAKVATSITGTSSRVPTPTKKYYFTNMTTTLCSFVRVARVSTQFNTESIAIYT